MSPNDALKPENYFYAFKRVNGDMIINEGSEKCKFKIGDSHNND